MYSVPPNSAADRTSVPTSAKPCIWLLLKLMWMRRSSAAFVPAALVLGFLVEIRQLEPVAGVCEHHHLLDAGVLGDRHRGEDDAVRQVGVGFDVQRSEEHTSELQSH